jgi:metallo-beta-lactamase family protein
MAINSIAGPAIVISASGMADAGRIKHHLRHNIWREGASIVFVGFQAEGTTGRKIVDGAKKIRLFNDEIAVKARVFTINGFSAHAGQSQILDWLGHFRSRDMQVFLIHGEYGAQQVLAGLIKERFGLQVMIPEYLEETTLEPGRVLERVEYPEKAVPRIDWNYIIENIGARFAQIKQRRSQLESKPWMEQTEIRDQLLDLERVLAEINSEI